MNLPLHLCFLLATWASLSHGLQAPHPPQGTSCRESPATRRDIFRTVLVGSLCLTGAATCASNPALALDMDAFANAELDSDTTNCDPQRDPKCLPKMSKDEALCKYGQTGQARSEACQRVKAAGGQVSKPSKEKGLGGAYAM